MRKFILVLLVGFSLTACQHEQTVIKMKTSLGDIRLRLYEETPLHKENMVKLVREGFYNGVLFHRVIQDFMIQAGDPESKTAQPGALLGEGDLGYTLEAEILPQYFHKKGVLAAAREGDEVNPERRSSGSHFYIVQGKKYTESSLEKAVESINKRRYNAILSRLQSVRKAEIAACEEAKDEAQLKQIKEELTNEAKQKFEQVKLRLSDAQKAAYTSVGGTPHLDGEYTVFGEVIEGLDVLDRIAAQETDENDRPFTDVVIERMEIERR